jgi:hypothetical protein
MKAYVYGANGAAITDIPKPAPKGTQVLVKVHACGLNRADLGMTKGHVHGAAGGVGTVLGMEWAGEVAELGPEARGVKVGDRIMGSGGAAFAEYTLADHGRIFRSPSNMNFDEAATLPVALTTMHNAVVTNGALRPGQSVMIQGASSGVGLMAMQIAKLKGASLVVGSSTDAYRRGRLKEFGADLAVDSSDPTWVDQVLRFPARSRAKISPPPRSRGASSMSAGSAAPAPSSISTSMPRAASTISASPSAPAPSTKSARFLTTCARTSGARWSRGNCNCRSTRSTSSRTSEQRSTTWKPTSIWARSS